ICCEAGGPSPGTGCAGRGIIAALEKLAERGAFDTYRPDVVFYDVLGDVVCGGFTMPMRPGYAEKVFVVTSGENMSIHAAANIAMAVEGFRGRGYAEFAGLILNRRGVKNEDEKVAELAEDIHSSVIGSLSRSQTVLEAEELGRTVIEAFPESAMAQEYRLLAEAVMRAAGGNI
nr:nitrogenase iron protein [Clostridiales bacterium]